MQTSISYQLLLVCDYGFQFVVLENKILYSDFAPCCSEVELFSSVFIISKAFNIWSITTIPVTILS